MKSTIVREADVAFEVLPENLVPAQRAPECAEPKTVEGWLEKFSSMSADDISWFLRDANVVGMPGIPSDCGLAVFFRRVTGQHVHVNGHSIQIMAGAASRGYLTPQTCREFIVRFDSGHYPFLYRSRQPVTVSAPQFLTHATTDLAKVFNVPQWTLQPTPQWMQQLAGVC